MNNEAGTSNHSDTMKTPSFCKLADFRTVDQAIKQAMHAIGITIGKKITLVDDPISPDNEGGYLAHFEIQ